MNDSLEASPASRDAEAPLEGVDANLDSLNEVKRGLSVYEEETKRIAPVATEEDADGNGRPSSPPPGSTCSDFHMSSVSAEGRQTELGEQQAADVRVLRQKVEALEQLVRRRLSIEAKLNPEIPEELPVSTAPVSRSSSQANGSEVGDSRPQRLSPELPAIGTPRKVAHEDLGAKGEDTDGVPDDILENSPSAATPEPQQAQSYSGQCFFQSSSSAASAATVPPNVEAPQESFVERSPSAASSGTIDPDDGRTLLEIQSPDIPDAGPFARILRAPEPPTLAASPSWQAIPHALQSQTGLAASLSWQAIPQAQGMQSRSSAPARAQTQSPELLNRSPSLGPRTEPQLSPELGRTEPQMQEEMQKCYVLPVRVFPSSASTSAPSWDNHSARMESAPCADVSEAGCYSARHCVQEKFTSHSFQGPGPEWRSTPMQSPSSTWRVPAFQGSTSGASPVPSSMAPTKGLSPVISLRSPKIATRVTVGSVASARSVSRPVSRPPASSTPASATTVNTGRHQGQAWSCIVPATIAVAGEAPDTPAEPVGRELLRSSSASRPPTYIQAIPGLPYRTTSPIGGRSTVGGVVSSSLDDMSILLGHGFDCEQAKRKLEQDYKILRARGADWEHAKRKLEQERSKIQATVHRLEAALAQANQTPGGNDTAIITIEGLASGPAVSAVDALSAQSIRRRSSPIRQTPQPQSARVHRSESGEVGLSTRGMHVSMMRTSPLQSARIPHEVTGSAMIPGPSCNSAASSFVANSFVTAAGTTSTTTTTWAAVERDGILGSAMVQMGGGSGSAGIAAGSWDGSPSAAPPPAGYPQMTAGGAPPHGQSPGFTHRSSTPVAQTRSPMSISPAEITRSPMETVRIPAYSTTEAARSPVNRTPPEAFAMPVSRCGRSVEAPRGRGVSPIGRRNRTPPRLSSSANCAREELVVHSARAYQISKQTLEAQKPSPQVTLVGQVV